MTDEQSARFAALNWRVLERARKRKVRVYQKTDRLCEASEQSNPLNLCERLAAHEPGGPATFATKAIRLELQLEGGEVP